jgi:hypothetical protein
MIRKIFPLLATTVILASCSSVYKSSQTPDDVYYSPSRQGKYVSRNQSDNNEYQDYTSSSDNRYLRMKAQNRYRWSSIDDFDYWNNPGYAYNNYYSSYGRFNPYFNNNWYSGYSYGYNNNFWLSYNTGWFNSYYPSYGYGSYTPIYVIKNPTKTTSVYRPQLSGYNNRSYNNKNIYNSTNNRQGLGSTLRRAFTPSNNNSYNNNNKSYNNNHNYNNNSVNDRPVRSYTPSSSNNSSSNSGNTNSGAVSRPPRKN